MKRRDKLENREISVKTAFSKAQSLLRENKINIIEYRNIIRDLLVYIKKNSLNNEAFELNSYVDFSRDNKFFTEEKNKILLLSYEIMHNILEALKHFEKSKKFIRPNITLHSLASELNTNAKYLSKTINQHKQKTFTQYINDLRIAYLLEKLKTDKRYTDYKIKAIASEIGFNTSNAFSRAFFKKTGKYPSDYIKELDT